MLPCGHVADRLLKTKRMRAGICPGCAIPMVLITDRPMGRILTHFSCECCDLCWALFDGRVRVLTHG